MKILFLFLDMIRIEQLLKNNKLNDNPLSKELKQIGGELFINCYTPVPDTTRSMAALWSGLPPFYNKCDTRIKWARYYLSSKIDTIFDPFIEKKFKIDIFHEPGEREVGLFPKKIYTYANFNTRYNLDNFLDNLQLQDNHVVFIGISDFHLAYNDSGYTKEGAKNSFEVIAKGVNKVFSKIDKDIFDHIFIFSDHGFAFSDEVLNSYNYISNIRSNILMQYRSKGEKNIVYNKKFCSIMSVLPTIDELFNIKKERYDYSLFSNQEREYITIIDHFNYQPRLNHNIDLWGLIFKDKIYSRTVENGYLIFNKDINNYKIKIISDYDEILKKETNFKEYIYEYEVLKKHKEWMKKEQNLELDRLAIGVKRKRIKKSLYHKIISRLKIIKSCIFFKHQKKLGFKDMVKVD